MIRLRTADRVADSGLLALEIAALTAAGFSAWYGGRFGGNRVYARRETRTARSVPPVAAVEAAATNVRSGNR
jgi:hypothetical protein